MWLPFDHLSSVASRIYIHGFHGTLTKRKESSWLVTKNRAQHRHQVKHTLSLSVKEAYLLVLELEPKGQTSDLTHIQAGKMVDAIFIFILCFIPASKYILERALYPCLAPKFLQLLPRGYWITWL